MIPNQELLEDIFTQSFNAIAITNTDFKDLKFEYVNPAFLNLTGYTVNEIIGFSPKILQGELTKKEETKRLKDLCQKGEIFKGDNINYKKDGSTYWVEWTVSPIKNDLGEIVNFLSIQKNITNEKKLEEQLMESVKLNTIYSLSSGLTHELNTSLTTIKGSTEMLHFDIEELEDDKLASRMAREIKTLHKSISHISNITNSLHYLTNAEVKLAKQVNIFDLLIEALSPYKLDLQNFCTCTINEKNPFDKRSVHYKEYYADIQKNSILHVFMIIIDNALYEIKKKDDRSNSLFKINITQDNKFMSIDFMDNAGGIKNKNVAKIFNALYKEKDSGGLGMGLHVAKNIMKDNGGDIQAFSTPPKTLLKVTIPL